MLSENHIWRIKLRSFKPEKIRVCWGDRVNPKVRNIIEVPDVTLQLIKTHEGSKHSFTVVVNGYTNTHTKKWNCYFYLWNCDSVYFIYAIMS